jgi:hypothetical protein
MKCIGCETTDDVRITKFGKYTIHLCQLCETSWRQVMRSLDVRSRRVMMNIFGELGKQKNEISKKDSKEKTSS